MDAAERPHKKLIVEMINCSAPHDIDDIKSQKMFKVDLVFGVQKSSYVSLITIGLVRQKLSR